MKQPLILNPILSRIHNNDQKNYLKNKIKEIKPMVDSKCPECFYYIQNKFGKTQKNNYDGAKTNMNINILRKIKFNTKTKKNRSKTKYRPLFKYDHDFLSYWRKEALINVAIENLNIYNRLNSKKGTYPLKNHLKDYEKAQYYKKNYCKFPSIDFYRTSKTNNSKLCPIFNYCTFYNYKTINDKFTSECLKRTNSQIMSKTKSVPDLFNMSKKKTYYLFPFKNKNKDEEKKSDKNNIKKKKILRNVRNNLYQNSEKSKDNKKEEEIKKNNQEENINNVNKENNNINIEKNNNDHENTNNKNEKIQNNNSKNNQGNNEDKINTNEIRDNIEHKDNNDNIINSKNKGISEREYISEKIECEDNNKEQKIEFQKMVENNYNNKENNKIKEESVIEESIDNEKEKNKNKKEIVEEKKEEINEEIRIEDNNFGEKVRSELNKKINNEDEEDKFVDVLGDI